MLSSALADALLLVSADLLARALVAPTELPVGAPFLLWLLAATNRAGGGT